MELLKCGLPSCSGKRLKDCSACLNEGYCNVLCQKKDWMIHKIVCGCMKYCDRQLPFIEVENKMDKLTRHFELKKGTDSEIRILRCRHLFAEQQYGYQILGSKKAYRKRGDLMIENWDIDIMTLYNCSMDLGAAIIDTDIIREEELSIKVKDTINEGIYYFESTLYFGALANTNWFGSKGEN
jgi:hypothetical protein